MNIVVTDSTFAPGVATISNVGLVDITALASNTLNAALWSGIGVVEIGPGSVNDTVTGISNASIATTYELNTPGNDPSLWVGFSSTGTGHFSIDSGISKSDMATLDATGTGIASGIANALTGATIATAGNNWDTINLGTNDHNVTLTGTGTDVFTFGPLATSGGLTVDWHTMSTNQTFTFNPGDLNTNGGNAVSILGGTGTNDSVTAKGGGTRKVGKSAVTGKFVTPTEVKRHPRTTFVETSHSQLPMWVICWAIAS